MHTHPQESLLHFYAQYVPIYSHAAATVVSFEGGKK